MLAIFCTMVGVALQYPAQARFMPLVVGLPGIGLCLVQVVLEVAARRRAAGGAGASPARGAGAPAQPGVDAAAATDTADTAGADGAAGAGRREIVLWCAFIGLVTSLILFGFWPTIPAFLLAFLRGYARESWRFSLALSAAGTAVLVLVFHVGLGVVLHQGFLLEPLLDHLPGA